MSSVTEVSKTIKLDLSGIPSDKIAEVKKEVGDFLIEEILRNVGDGKSPVKGERWKILDKDYADEFKGGNRTPTMQLYGDLLDSLKVEDVGGSAIKIGHFGKDQAPKADGHNQHSLEAQKWAASRDFPRRRYIPSEGQNFKSDIARGIEDIISGYRVQARLESGDLDEDEFIRVGSITEVDISEEATSVTTQDFFSEDVIIALIEDVRRRRR